MRFRVDGIAEGKVLLHQPLQAAGNLFLIAFCLGYDGHGKAGLWQLNARQHDLTGRFAKRVAGIGICKFCHNAYIARGELCGLDLLFAEGDINAAELFVLAGYGVDNALVAAECAGNNFKEGHLADERVGHCLEYGGAERSDSLVDISISSPFISLAGTDFM